MLHDMKERRRRALLDGNGFWMSVAIPKAWMDMDASTIREKLSHLDRRFLRNPIPTLARQGYYFFHHFVPCPVVHAPAFPVVLCQRASRHAQASIGSSVGSGIGSGIGSGGGSLLLSQRPSHVCNTSR